MSIISRSLPPRRKATKARKLRDITFARDVMQRNIRCLRAKFACNSYSDLGGVRNVGSLYAGRLSPDQLPPIITGNSGKDQREWKLANNGFSRSGDNGLSRNHYHSTLAAISSSLYADYNNLDGFDLYGVSFLMARPSAVTRNRNDAGRDWFK